MVGGGLRIQLWIISNTMAIRTGQDCSELLGAARSEPS